MSVSLFLHRCQQTVQKYIFIPSFGIKISYNQPQKHSLRHSEMFWVFSGPVCNTKADGWICCFEYFESWIAFKNWINPSYKWRLRLKLCIRRWLWIMSAIRWERLLLPKAWAEALKPGVTYTWSMTMALDSKRLNVCVDACAGEGEWRVVGKQTGTPGADNQTTVIAPEASPTRSHSRCWRWRSGLRAQWQTSAHVKTQLQHTAPDVVSASCVPLSTV